MTNKILIFFSDTQTAAFIERAIMRPAGYQILEALNREQVLELAEQHSPDLAILDARLKLNAPGLELAALLRARQPNLPVVLVVEKVTAELALQALRAGAADLLTTPLQADEITAAARRSVEHNQQLHQWMRLQNRRNTRSLQQRLSVLESVHAFSQEITSLLEMDKVLTATVDAAVELTGAEEGSLLLVDELSGELFMQAARNFGDEFVHTFRLPVQDTLPGQVLLSGKPLILNTKTPKKIKTSYLVHNLIYVPLRFQGHSLGVLGVDNRQANAPFTAEHLALITSLADYAAIAIENARLYQQSENERNKLETILRGVEDGVLILDADERVILLNQTFRQAFDLGDQPLVGRRIREFVTQQDILELLEEPHTTPSQREIALEDGRVMNAQATPIPAVGLAITMQDITHLIELDRIKSDFVSTVSHDLRSPLTAIMGYVELLGRIGPINEQQKEFVRRVQVNVQNITSLIDDLLDLGRIEAGFESGKEIVPIDALLRYVFESLKGRSLGKGLSLTAEIPNELPQVVGNTVRLRQMVSNLMENAIKYTQRGGEILLQARAEDGQILLQVIDNGPGIPIADQPYIFDKFYRASNVPEDVPGTGLGLAIVKSIVENHRGRIWVETAPGKGTTFSVVLPAAG